MGFLKRTQSMEKFQDFHRGPGAATTERCCPAVLPVRTLSSQISGTCVFFLTKETFRLSDQMSSKRKPVNTAAFMLILMKVCIGVGLSCHPAEYKIGNECCPKCLPGSRVKTHCNEFRSTSCLPCVDGTYTDKSNGLDRCTPCTNCHSGSSLRVKTPCTVTSDTICEPLEGFYCTNFAEHSCEKAQRHSSCKPGQYISQNGTASTDNECSDCSSGTFSNGTFYSCQPHTQCHLLNLQQITEGTSAADTQCGEKSDHVGAAIGGAVAGLIVIIAAVSGFLYFKKKREKHRRSKDGKKARFSQNGRGKHDEAERKNMVSVHQNN